MPSNPSGALIPTLECLLAQAEHSFQRWNTFWPKQDAHSNVGIPSGPSGARGNTFWPKRSAYSNVGVSSGLSGALIPTLEYLLAQALIPTLEYLLAEAARSFQRWNTFWPKRGAYSNVGMPSGPSGALIPTLEYLLAQAGRSSQRWNTLWPKQNAHSNFWLKRSLF